MLAKLTLNADPETIALAKRLAAEQGTSISRMFVQFIRRTAEQREVADEADPPILRRLRGILPPSPGKTDRELIEEALLERHGLQ
jgi:Family of unknown function (DUF6364)